MYFNSNSKKSESFEKKFGFNSNSGILVAIIRMDQRRKIALFYAYIIIFLAVVNVHVFNSLF